MSSGDVDRSLDKLIEEIVERDSALRIAPPPKRVERAPRRGQGVVRVSTGIPELDRALERGVPKGSWVAITGEPGTGKYIMCMHFAYAGLKAGDPVIYVTTEAEFRDVVRQAAQFGMDFEEFSIYSLGGREPSEKPRIVVIDIFGLLKMAMQLSSTGLDEEASRRRRYAALEIPTLIAAIHEAYKVLGVVEEGKRSPRTHVRLIIDSMSAFWADKPAMARRFSYELKIATHRENVTAYLVSQYAMTTKSLCPTTRLTLFCGGRRLSVTIEGLFNMVSSGALPCRGGLFVPSLDPATNSVVLGRVTAVWRHPIDGPLYRVVTYDDREIVVTHHHSLYVLRHRTPRPVPTTSLRRGDLLLAAPSPGDPLPSMLQGVRVSFVEPIEPHTQFVYDISVSPFENFLAGEGSILAHNSTFGFGLEHIADGVFHLWMDDVERVKEVRRYFIVKKMRMTNHSRRAYRLEIVDGKGIVLQELNE